MKLNFWTLVLLMAGCNLTALSAEPEVPVKRCATTEYWEQKIVANPSLARQFQQENNYLEQLTQRNTVNRQSNAVVTIPVVVHVVWRTAIQSISDAQILSQIDVLNEDFARLNADTNNTPAAFRPVAAPTNFRFCLAQVDTNGNPTNGIERRQTTVTSFSTNDNVKRYANGGLNPWDQTRYLNIWVCNMGGGILGYGEFPTAAASATYGLVVTYNAFGRGAGFPLLASYNLGRTAVHEISHCFRLSHIWGDDNGACSGSDFCSDTPNQAGENYGCPNYPVLDACQPSGNGVQFMNYMDYGDDICLNMFTNQQSLRMSNAMNTFYPDLLSSTACESPTGISELDKVFSFSVYPNPADGIFNLDLFLAPASIGDLQLTISDQLGRVVEQQLLTQPAGQVIQLDMRRHADGVYFLNLSNTSVNRTVRLILAR
jgi:hypothetical protein